MIIIQLLILLIVNIYLLTPVEAVDYAVSKTFTPVLNTADFKTVFGGVTGENLKTDRCGQVRELEYIAPPGSVFTVLQKRRSGTADIYQVETDEYTPQPKVRLYVDGRYILLTSAVPAPRALLLPSLDEIVAVLKASVGSPYVWGGNVPYGVPELVAWFNKGIRDGNEERLPLAGLDCSGLLYYATGGWTPRNTSQLITFGQSVNIAGKQSEEIVKMLQPLDLIVWSGHVIIVLDHQTAIESRLDCGKPGNGGVVITQISQRLAEVMRTRRPKNNWAGGGKKNIFVIKRWYTR